MLAIYDNTNLVRERVARTFWFLLPRWPRREAMCILGGLNYRSHQLATSKRHWRIQDIGQILFGQHALVWASSPDWWWREWRDNIVSNLAWLKQYLSYVILDVIPRLVASMRKSLITFWRWEGRPRSQVSSKSDWKDAIVNRRHRCRNIELTNHVSKAEALARSPVVNTYYYIILILKKLKEIKATAFNSGSTESCNVRSCDLP